jgi:hypothetical protein
LRHADQVPQYASRKQRACKTTALSEEEAMKLFPIGTALAREDEGGTYIKGAIAGYYRPWWRAKYKDEVWEDLTRTEVKIGIKLLLFSAESRQVARPVLKMKESLLTGTGDVVPQYPENFESECRGKLILLRWTTGWYNGIVNKSMPKDGVYEVQYEGDSGPRDSLLSKELYSISRNACVGSWHVVNKF